MRLGLTRQGRGGDRSCEIPCSGSRTHDRGVTFTAGLDLMLPATLTSPTDSVVGLCNPNSAFLAGIGPKVRKPACSRSDSRKAQRPAAAD